MTSPRRKPFQLSLEELCLLARFVADDIGFLLAPPQSLASPFASLCFVFLLSISRCPEGCIIHVDSSVV